MWVICACRDFQVEKVDIIELLQEDEVRRLECLGELSTSNQRAEAGSDEEEQAFDAFLNKIEGTKYSNRVNP